MKKMLIKNDDNNLWFYHLTIVEILCTVFHIFVSLFWANTGLKFWLENQNPWKCNPDALSRSYKARKKL